MQSLLILTISFAAFFVVANAWARFSHVSGRDYSNFTKRHNKSCNDSSVQLRTEIYRRVDQIIQLVNNFTTDFQLEHNFFSDMTDGEKTTTLGLVLPPSFRSQESADFDQHLRSNPVVPPRSFDLRTNWCLPPIKNQGRQCASSWAFSAITPLEFAACSKNKRTRTLLSEQQLLDCDTSNGGCNGGWMPNAWNYLKARGSAKSSLYPYTSLFGKVSRCKLQTFMIGARLSSYISIPSKNVTAIQQALLNGPVSVAMIAEGLFFNYRAGVYSVTCSPTSSVNHAVVLVGWGVSLSGIDYWILRNSWGLLWGESGYMFIRRGVNLCKIEEYPFAVMAG